MRRAYGPCRHNEHVMNKYAFIRLRIPRQNKIGILHRYMHTWIKETQFYIQYMYVCHAVFLHITQLSWLIVWNDIAMIMMTSSNGHIFRVTGHLCGESPVPGEFPAQRPLTRNFDVFFDLRLNKRLSKQSWGWWFETLSRPLWRHRNVIILSIDWQLVLYSHEMWMRIWKNNAKQTFL